ncbi:unnamed protein product [Blepharisma stoltei]|uniref:Syntaxin-18 n=1 Tax=Blepharisma stoltei TaxID=1481888 RepID=A0AAU9ID14_9CILI|nr:unnamed protein product [Blepharisma stoltei]
MTDITENIFSEHTYLPNEKSSEFIKKSTDLCFQIIRMKSSLSETLKQLKAHKFSLQSKPENEAVAFMAKCNREIESLKQLKKPKNQTEECHLNSIISCLYSHMSDITDITKQIQILKQKQLARIQELEKARANILSKEEPSVEIHRSIIENVKTNEGLEAENQQLLSEYKEENESILKSQQTAYELNSILSFFAQKVLEHEEMTQHILQEAQESLSYMKVANYHLNSANERSKGQEKWWIAYFLTLTFILWFYDWWTCRVVYITD